MGPEIHSLPETFSGDRSGLPGLRIRALRTSRRRSLPAAVASVNEQDLKVRLGGDNHMLNSSGRSILSMVGFNPSSQD